MDREFGPQLGAQAWKIVVHLRGGDKLRFNTAATMYETYDPSGTYSSQRFPSSAVRQLIAEGVIGQDLEPTAEGREWLGVNPEHYEMDHEGVVEQVELARQIQASNLARLESDLNAIAEEIRTCPTCQAVGNVVGA